MSRRCFRLAEHQNVEETVKQPEEKTDEKAEEKPQTPVILNPAPVEEAYGDE
ncbi:MAG: hypothetical protein ACYCX5_12580 [Coriobacteriia bacterium]